MIYYHIFQSFRLQCLLTALESPPCAVSICSVGVIEKFLFCAACGENIRQPTWIGYIDLLSQSSQLAQCITATIHAPSRPSFVAFQSEQSTCGGHSCGRYGTWTASLFLLVREKLEPGTFSMRVFVSNHSQDTMYLYFLSYFHCPQCWIFKCPHPQNSFCVDFHRAHLIKSLTEKES